MKFILLITFSLFSLPLFSQDNIEEKVYKLFVEYKFNDIISLKQDIINSNASDSTYYKLAIAYYDGNKFKDAIEFFNIVIGKDSSALGSYYYASKSLETTGNVDEAMNMIEAGIRHHPDYSNYYSQKGQLKLKQGKTDEAKELFQKAISIDETNPAAYYKLARFYVDMDNFTEAIKIFEEGIKKSDKELWEYASLLQGLAYLYTYRGEYSKSNDLCIEFLKYRKNNIETYEKIIQNYFALSLYDFAKKYQDELYKMYGDKKIPKEMNGEYCFDVFKWEEGIFEAYEKFETPPNDGTILRFHKHVFYFYGKDDKLKFSIQTELFSSFGEKLSFDYVLGKSETRDGVYYHSTYTTLNYSLPMNYKKLKEDILKVLNNKVAPVTSSTRKLKDKEEK